MAMRRMYLQGVGSAMQEEVMQTMSGYAFWSEGSEDECERFLDLFRFF